MILVCCCDTFRFRTDAGAFRNRPILSETRGGKNIFANWFAFPNELWAGLQYCAIAARFRTLSMSKMAPRVGSWFCRRQCPYFFLFLLPCEKMERGKRKRPLEPRNRRVYHHLLSLSIASGAPTDTSILDLKLKICAVAIGTHLHRFGIEWKTRWCCRRVESVRFKLIGVNLKATPAGFRCHRKIIIRVMYIVLSPLIHYAAPDVYCILNRFNPTRNVKIITEKYDQLLWNPFSEFYLGKKLEKETASHS